MWEKLNGYRLLGEAVNVVGICLFAFICTLLSANEFLEVDARVIANILEFWRVDMRDINRFSVT